MVRDFRGGEKNYSQHFRTGQTVNLKKVYLLKKLEDDSLSNCIMSKRRIYGDRRSGGDKVRQRKDEGLNGKNVPEEQNNVTMELTIIG